MCDCIKTMNAKLKENYGGDLELLTLISWGDDHEQAILSTQGKPAKRGRKAPNLIATFCPFCGERYKGE